MPTIKTSKEEILQKSLLLIWEKGYHYTSIGDLAATLGMAKSHCYYYFKDKEEIKSSSIPRGGTLLSASSAVIGMNVPHFIDQPTL